MPHKKADLTLHGVFPFPGHKTEHVGRTARWIQQTREHFQSGRFPCTVRPKKADEITLLNLKGDVFHRVRLNIFAIKEPFDRAADSPLLTISAERLGESPKFDGKHGPFIVHEAAGPLHRAQFRPRSLN